MNSKRAKLEAAGLTLATAVFFLGSIALVLPPVSPEAASAAGPAGWIDAWTVAGCEVRAAGEQPDALALEAWRASGLADEPHAVRFVHPEFGVVAKALVGNDGGVLVYEAGNRARLLHPAIGTADLHAQGVYYVAAGSTPIERRKLD